LARRGGADFSHGSGLVGLNDRAEALGGHLRLYSPSGAGTTLDVALPLRDPGARGLPGNASRGLAADPEQRFDHPGVA
jgi:signal transduction histidine kinase